MDGLLKVIEASKVEKGVAIWWLGGTSYVLKSPRALIYVDLFTGPAPSATLMKLTKDIPDLIDPQDIVRADLVLSTHEHIDHCHRESLEPIYRDTEAMFVGAPSSVRHFKEWGFEDRRIVELRSEQYFEHLDIEIRALPSVDCTDKDAVTFMIQVQDVCLFEGGDTLYFEGLKEIGRNWDIDIASLNFFTNPPGADEKQSMEPTEVAQAAIDLGASYLILKHWDIWKELKGDPREVAKALEGSSVKAVNLRPGEKYVIRK